MLTRSRLPDGCVEELCLKPMQAREGLVLARQAMLARRWLPDGCMEELHKEGSVLARGGPRSWLCRLMSSITLTPAICATGVGSVPHHWHGCLAGMLWRLAAHGSAARFCPAPHMLHVCACASCLAAVALLPRRAGLSPKHPPPVVTRVQLGLLECHLPASLVGVLFPGWDLGNASRSRPPQVYSALPLPLLLLQ